MNTNSGTGAFLAGLRVRMWRLAVLAWMVGATTAVGAASPSVTVKTVTVTPKIIREEPARPSAAPVRRNRGRVKLRPIARVHHVPRPLSPGEFGRARHGL